MGQKLRKTHWIVRLVARDVGHPRVNADMSENGHLHLFITGTKTVHARRYSFAANPFIDATDAIAIIRTTAGPIVRKLVEFRHHALKLTSRHVERMPGSGPFSRLAFVNDHQHALGPLCFNRSKRQCNHVILAMLPNYETNAVGTQICEIWQVRQPDTDAFAHGPYGTSSTKRPLPHLRRVAVPFHIFHRRQGLGNKVLSRQSKSDAEIGRRDDEKH